MTNQGIVCGDAYDEDGEQYFFREAVHQFRHTSKEIAIAHMNDHGDAVGWWRDEGNPVIWYHDGTMSNLTEHISLSFQGIQRQQHSDAHRTFDTTRTFFEKDNYVEFLADNGKAYGYANNGYFVARYAYSSLEEDTLTLDVNYSSRVRLKNGYEWVDGVPVLLGGQSSFFGDNATAENCYFFDAVLDFLNPYNLVKPYRVGDDGQESYLLIQPVDPNEVPIIRYGISNTVVSRVYRVKGNYFVTEVIPIRSDQTSGESGFYLNNQLLTAVQL